MAQHTIGVLLTASTGGFRAQMTAAARSVQGFERSVEGSSQKTQSFGTKIQNVFRNATGVQGLTAAFTAVAAAVGYSVVAAANFEAAMRNVNSISGLSDQALQKMSASVLQLSTQVPQSATTLAEGLYEIASSGFQGAEGLQVLEASAIAASAGLSTTDVAAKAIVGVLNAYGLEAADAADVSDTLFQTVNVGVLSFADLASQLGDVIGMAAAAGVEIDEVGAAIAAMTLSGISAAESTTSLNALLRALIDPSDALVTLYDQWGVESGEAAIAQYGLYGVMEKVRESTGGNVTELLKLFPEIRAGRGAFALLSASMENYRTTQEAITNEQERAGATQEAFNEQMRSTSSQAKLFANEIQAVAIQFGTALLPAVQDGISFLRDFGAAAGDVLSDLGRQAAPAVEALRDAFTNVASVADGLYDALQPVAKLLAGAFAAGAIAGLTLFADALSAVAGTIASNEVAIQALAAVLGGVLLGRLVATAAAAAKFAIQFRALLVMETLGPIMSTLAGRIGLLGAAFTNLRLGNVGAAAGAARGAFAGLGAALASPALIGTAVVGGFIGITTAVQNSRNAAKEMRAEFEADIDTSSIESVRDGIEDMTVRVRELEEFYYSEGRGDGGGLFTVLKSAAQIALPWVENEIMNNVDALNEMDAGLESARRLAAIFDHDVATLANTMGVSESQVRRFLEAMDIGPDDMDTTTVPELANGIRDFAIEAAGATPVSAQLAGAFETAGAAGATAADQVSALKDGIDALIGTLLGSSNAAVAFESSLDDLSDVAAESGMSLDIGTRAGQAYVGALNSMAESAIDHANAVATETGSVAAGVDVLRMHREQMIQAADATGMTRQAAEDYIDELGFWPSNLETLIALEGGEETLATGAQIEAQMRAIGQAETGVTVTMNSEDFDGDARLIGDTLVRIGQADPEAVVTMDGEQFRATSAQIDAWIAAYGSDTPEAQAILDIIDPQNDFATLEALAASYETSRPATSANLNSDEANANFDHLMMRNGDWDGANSEATATVNDDDVVTSYSQSARQAENWGRTDTSSVAGVTDKNQGGYRIYSQRSTAWGGTNTSSTAGARDNNSGRYAGFFGRARTWGGTNTSSSAGARDNNSGQYSGFFGRAKDWGGTNTSATASVHDNATGTLSNIKAGLSGLHDKTVTVTVNQKGFFQRWGGYVPPVHAATGLARQATVANSPQVHWAEPETGGEIYVPRLGIRSRSLTYLAMGANWYGMRLIPEGEDEYARYGHITGRNEGSRPYGAYTDAARSFAAQVEAQAHALGPRLTDLANTSVQNLLVQFGDGLEGLFGQLIPNTGVRSMVTNAMRTSLGQAGVGGGSTVAVDVGGLHVSLSGLAGLDEQKVADKVRGEMKTLVRDLTQQIKALTATRGT